AGVVAGELQLGGHCSRQAQADAAAVDAGEHFVADEIGVEAVDPAGADAGEFQQQRIELRLGAGTGVGHVLWRFPELPVWQDYKHRQRRRGRLPADTFVTFSYIAARNAPARPGFSITEPPMSGGHEAVKPSGGSKMNKLIM